MSLTVKAYLHSDWLSEPIETRRFTIDQDVATSYTYLTEKLAQIFSNVNNRQAQNISISYLDVDGDRISVSSDEELADALGQFDGTIFRLHIKNDKTTDKAETVNNGVAAFLPPLFQLASLFGSPQFNPSGGCCSSTPTVNNQCNPQTNETPTEAASDDKSANDENEPQKKSSTQQGPRHPGVVCDGCSGSIYGRRFKCVTCPDYDLCAECEGKGQHTDHSMYVIDQPCQARQSRWGRPSNYPQGPNWGGNFGGLWGNLGGSFNPFQTFGHGPCYVPTGNQCCQQKSTKDTTGSETGETSSTVPPSSVPNVAFNEVLEQLKGMGFEADGGWLYDLVKAKEGDLQKILDALNPAEAVSTAPTTEED